MAWEVRPDMATDSEGFNKQRRMLLGAGVTGCVGAMFGARIEQVKAAATASAGDVLVHFKGDNTGLPIDPAGLKFLEPVLAKPQSPDGQVRDARENIVTVVRVPREELEAEFESMAAGDIVAVSAICSHQGCLVSDVGTFGTAEGKLACTCHGSIFEPRAGGKRVAGPAERGLPMLPVTVDGAKLIATGGFAGKVG
ncbi:Rieske (2Fe-2S) protein [Spiribacter roseus]|jgi:rieske iron-sulfur protein|uniref:QcrA and Rieske domain-containing protein n=1 Tax=Spiribacter roseus TaxID=1855875 RepID=UPI0011D0BD96